MPANPLLSLVITLLNEEDNIAPLLTRIREAMQGYSYEVILVDDGSTDQTVTRIRELADETVRLVILNKNYGQTTAMSAGIAEAKAPYIVTLDGDLQNDPADIPVMLEKLEREGWDVVAGVRAKRQDGVFLRKIPSKIANALIRRMTGVYLHDYGCTLKLFRAQIAQNLGLYGELHRFIPVLAAMQGARMTEMPVRHHARQFGQSKYGLGRTFKVMSDLLLMVFFQKYFRRPMHLFGPVGILTFLSGGLIGLYLLGLKLTGESIGNRPLLTLAVILLLGGLQIVTFGFMAEIMMRTYYETGTKSTYLVREIYQKS
ncbi:glycosyltransferase family 2 protein [Siphonobacter aquaeclarae]|uniref:Glycosyltransferase involved in cell wall bisynthesis n=1 Tax=Siphonobacter aquaeclarae TaxID=563176 RepID=A0A1G9T6R4_9BACT|nr:glycosyltransferase family 2 protein [Siphonobacter aquaeclarae]SDM42765.1 Glycosyltransferase involved in cell wall bisynthesis [Siphonobacter aquaeclarae]